jgi:hypothetical protein
MISEVMKKKKATAKDSAWWHISVISTTQKAKVRESQLESDQTKN